MTPERWQRISTLFQEALDRPTPERQAFLDAACDGDQSLRREVESLISTDEQAGDFIAQPAFELAVEMLADNGYRLAPGQAIGPYVIISLLGAGGMGEVYLAEDTRLSRNVAIKFLPTRLTTDKQAGKRLIREAKAAAKLDHPNICAIYEVGTQADNSFIVMQYIEGETLANRLQRERLEFCDTLDVAIQVAEALSEAHAHGIIHRDIKPQNIIITSRGHVKVLDFGLAKVIKQEMMLESEESLLSTPGAMIGTVPYMSPEQVKGETIDSRSDIFSFGAVLYEMICGIKPFASARAVAEILTREPAPIAQYRADAPAEAQRIVNKALCKDKENRYQDIEGLLTDLKRLKEKLTLKAIAVKSQRSKLLDAIETVNEPPTEAQHIITNGLRKDPHRIERYQRIDELLDALKGEELAFKAFQAFEAEMKRSKVERRKLLSAVEDLKRELAFEAMISERSKPPNAIGEPAAAVSSSELAPEFEPPSEVEPLGDFLPLAYLPPLDYLEAEVRRVDKALGVEFLRNESPSILTHTVIGLVDLIAISVSCSPFLSFIRVAEGTFTIAQTRFASGAIIALISFFYLALCQSLSARTFGMMLTNTRVVDRHTFDALSPSQALIRTAGYFIAAAPAMAGFIWAAFDREHRGWQDLISGTMVVRDF